MGRVTGEEDHRTLERAGKAECDGVRRWTRRDRSIPATGANQACAALHQRRRDALELVRNRVFAAGRMPAAGAWRTWRRRDGSRSRGLGRVRAGPRPAERRSRSARRPRAASPVDPVQCGQGQVVLVGELVVERSAGVARVAGDPLERKIAVPVRARWWAADVEQRLACASASLGLGAAIGVTTYRHIHTELYVTCRPDMTLATRTTSDQGLPALRHPPAPAAADRACRAQIELDGGTRFAVSGLASLPRRELMADFHCVAGWSATGLRWEGVRFADFIAAVPVRQRRRPTSSSVPSTGSGRSWTLDDALADDVLLADRLDGAPLGADHGGAGPPRLSGALRLRQHQAPVPHRVARSGAGSRVRERDALRPRRLRAVWFKRHPRARVWQEERHRHLPGWAIRPIGRLFRGPTARLSRR